MKKTYFLLTPSDFLTYGEIDKEGNTTYKRSADFNVEDPGENYVIFEAYYEDTYNGRRYYREVKEKITGKVFDLQVIKGRNKHDGDSILINSEKHGLFQQLPAKTSDIEVKPIRVSGLLNYFQKNEKARNTYLSELGEFFENARAFNYMYTNSIGGPSNYLSRVMKREYKKVNRRIQ